MPELPDLTVYLEALEKRVVGDPLEAIRLASPFILRSVQPRPAEVVGKKVEALSRIGKRLVFTLEDDYHVVIHLMVAGRFRWKDEKGAKIPGRIGLAAFDFPKGTLLFTEASKKKRASLHLVKGSDDLAPFHRGGLEPIGASLEDFRAALTRERHTVKRALTDPRIFAGIGNAYSDEILHRAQLSPMARTDKLEPEVIARIHQATQDVMREWIERLRVEAGDAFPVEVTAFRPEMAVHGKYGQPCPVCGTAVQRMVYAENESNYCPRCQTGGKLLSDRSLSRLLKASWPKTIEELEGR